MERYQFILQDRYNPAYKYTTVAAIYDHVKKEPVLFIDCVPNLYNISGKYVMFAKEEEAKDPKLKGHFFGLAYVDPAYYDLFIEQFPHLGRIMFMHELGHYLNGDYKLLKSENNIDDDRLECIKKGKVQKNELEADKFAIQQCGINDYIDFIDCMIELRKARVNDPAREYAIKEFELRKEWTIKEFANSVKEIIVDDGSLQIVKMNMSMYYDVYRNSQDEDNRKYVPDEVFNSIEDARDVVTQIINNYESEEGPFVYAIFRKIDNANIGYVQLIKIEDGWEIGYHIAKDYTGNGYATEAVNLFLEYIKKHTILKQIFGIALASNLASRRVLEKCGFELIYEGDGVYQGAQRKIIKTIKYL
jgi:RimJ/RimL family protein N-acetyltransferase